MRNKARRVMTRCGKVLASAIATCSLVDPAQAIPRSWNTGNGNWSAAANWSPNGAPNNTDDITIAKGAFTTTMDVNGTAQSILIENGDGILQTNPALTFNT